MQRTGSTFPLSTRTTPSSLYNEPQGFSSPEDAEAPLSLFLACACSVGSLMSFNRVVDCANEQVEGSWTHSTAAKLVSKPVSRSRIRHALCRGPAVPHAVLTSTRGQLGRSAPVTLIALGMAQLRDERL